MKQRTELSRTPTPGLPETSTQIRELALQSAGFDPVTVGEWMKKSAAKLVEKLDATKTQFFTHEGIVTDQRECEDTAAQIKAASELLNLGVDIMALKRRAESETPPSPPITIDLSGWTVQAPVKELTDVAPD